MLLEDKKNLSPNSSMRLYFTRSFWEEIGGQKVELSNETDFYTHIKNGKVYMTKTEQWNQQIRLNSVIHALVQFCEKAFHLCVRACVCVCFLFLSTTAA